MSAIMSPVAQGCKQMYKKITKTKVSLSLKGRGLPLHTSSTKSLLQQKDMRQTDVTQSDVKFKDKKHVWNQTNFGQ